MSRNFKGPGLDIAVHRWAVLPLAVGTAIILMHREGLNGYGLD